jgi:hypothetical protein
MRILDTPPAVLLAALGRSDIVAAPDDLCPAVVLRSAAAYLDTVGWTQGTYYTYEPTGSRLPAACITGAVAISCYGYAHPMPSITEDDGRVAFETAMDALTVHLRHTTTGPGGLLVEPYGFNDHPTRTRADVVQALIAAADRHERQAHNDDAADRVEDEDQAAADDPSDDFAGTTADRKGGSAPGPTHPHRTGGGQS